MAELARANHSLERGALEEARQAIQAALAIDPQNVRALQLREQLERTAASDAAPSREAPGPARASGRQPPQPPGAWSAFEGRVRQRRAERCIESARAALASGDLAAARGALDELAAVMPGHAAIAELKELTDRKVAPPVAGRPIPPPVASPVTRPSSTSADQPRPSSPPVAVPAAAPAAPAAHSDLLSFTPELSLRPADRPAPPRPAPVVIASVAQRRRIHLPVVAAAAAVLLLGVLLPFDWSRRTDAPGVIADRGSVDAPVADVIADRESVDAPVADTETVADFKPDGARPAGGDDEAPLETADALRDEPSSAVPPEEVLARESSAAAPSAAGSGADDRAVMTSGATESAAASPSAGTGRASQPEEPAPAPRTAARETPPPRAAAAPAVTRARTDPAPEESSAVQEAYAARELARAEAAQRALLPVPLPGSDPGQTGVTPAPTVGGDGDAIGAAQPPLATSVSPQAPAYVPSLSTPPPAQAQPPLEPPREDAVRGVLQQYVAAYNRLDAVAARAVMPGVDQTALERAFSQLDSQTLRFERCDIDVDDEGGTATCAGQARWVPRVGARDPRREQRTWRFELARNGEDWIITRAEARR